MIKQIIETSAVEAERLPREAEMIRETRESVPLHGTISTAEVFAWVRSIGTDYKLPPPEPRKRA